jgi:hypothetical protein
MKARLSQFLSTARPILRPDHSKFVFAENDEAMFPSRCIRAQKDIPNSQRELDSARVGKTDEKNSVMSSGRELSHIREVKVLGYQKSAFRLSGSPDGAVVSSGNSLHSDVVDVMPQAAQHIDERLREVFVEFDFHRTDEVEYIGKSSVAAAAAKAITARSPSAGTVGKSPRISVSVAPSARLASSVRTGTRVPLMTSAPPPIPSFLSNHWAGSYFMPST